MIFSMPHILGSSKSRAIKYEVVNTGEIAYLPQIKIILQNTTSFSKVPSNCKLEDDEMLCELANGNPLYSNQSVSKYLSIYYASKTNIPYISF